MVGALCLQEGCILRVPNKCRAVLRGTGWETPFLPDSRSILELSPPPFCPAPQPPPKLPNGIFTQDFQEFVNKW